MGKSNGAQRLVSGLEETTVHGRGLKIRGQIKSRPVLVPANTAKSAARPLDESARSRVEQWLNKVTCGDCVELMNEMPVASVGMIVTSPPYNLRNSTGNGMKDGRGGK